MEKNFIFKIPEVKSSEKKSELKTEHLKGQREDRTDSGFFSESLTPKLPPEDITDAFPASTEVSEVQEGPTTSRKKFEDIPVFESDSETEEHQSSEKVIILTWLSNLWNTKDVNFGCHGDNQIWKKLKIEVFWYMW